MTCHDRDQDLLLYALAELPPWDHMRVALHLRGCRRCRARRAELAATSALLGGALRPPAGPGGGSGGTGLRIRLRPRYVAWLPALLLVLGLSVLTVTLVAVWHARARAVAQRTVRDEGCSPGLPSDLCR